MRNLLVLLPRYCYYFLLLLFILLLLLIILFILFILLLVVVAHSGFPPLPHITTTSPQIIGSSHYSARWN